MRTSHTVAIKLGRKALMLVSASLIALAAVPPAPAVASPTYFFKQTIAIPGATSTNKFIGYDLATFDNSTQLYYL
ncbi:MAG TPA: hypothetical protein VGT81_03490, partial [Casimicrobiaceae bacterium]|nr:hypothetical protein [Casimicrobiaceae bacterium]